jgi:hypothetical protein
VKCAPLYLFRHIQTIIQISCFRIEESGALRDEKLVCCADQTVLFISQTIVYRMRRPIRTGLPPPPPPLIILLTHKNTNSQIAYKREGCHKTFFLQLYAKRALGVPKSGREIQFRGLCPENFNILEIFFPALVICFVSCVRTYIDSIIYN